MELYTHSNNTVDFISPDPTGAVTATISVNGGLPASMTVATVSGIHIATVPYLTQDGSAKVVWSYSTTSGVFEDTDVYPVVTAYLPLHYIKSNLMTDATDAEVRMAEASVRHMINAYCQQDFLQSTQTISVTGTGGPYLHLSKRLIEVTSLRNGSTGASWYQYSIGNDGWTVKRREHPTMLGSDSITTNPIYDPYREDVYKWQSGVEFIIEGRWGWEAVPVAVQEAAKVLIEQRFCPGANYRDHYLTSVKAADWRFDYSHLAFVGTGNVVADHLLAKYVVQGIRVF